MKIFKKQILVGVSGGPDSMYLLWKLKKSLFYNPVAVHINYGVRESANDDEKIVRVFCKKNNIEFFSKKLINFKEKSNENGINNFEARAREERYNFFSEISRKKIIKKIFLGHHKDDFIETAIMQHKRNNNLLFYGIKKNMVHHGLEVKRILLKKWKKSIEKKCHKNLISYGVDETNFDASLERNSIRMSLTNKTFKEKEQIYLFFKNLNSKNELMRKKVDKNYDKWKKNDYSLQFFLSLDEKLKFFILYKFIKESNFFINITTQKINSIIDFLNSKSNKEYILSDDFILIINSNKIKIQSNKLSY